jgi:hypoxanthine-DNA glycosylase
MTRLRGFPPIARSAATRLVLGSMPGEASLAKGEYYGHPRNAFWPILGALLGFDPDAPYVERCEALRRARIALWDVLACCERPGSLDADIVASSIVPNDFGTFFAAHPQIRIIYFNGSTAESAFRRHVRALLPERLRTLPGIRLPSTSPAHAGRSFEAKRAAWSCLLEDAGNAQKNETPPKDSPEGSEV